jgi:hypothetical protein
MLDVLIPYAKETLTISSTALPLTVDVYKTGKFIDVQRAFITVEDAAIRFWTDGSTPASATDEGHLVEAGGQIELTLTKSITGFKAVRDTSTDAVLQVTYERDV